MSIPNAENRSSKSREVYEEENHCRTKTERKRVLETRLESAESRSRSSMNGRTMNMDSILEVT